MTAQACVLMVDPDQGLNWDLGRALEEQGLKVSRAATLGEAMEFLRREGFQLVISELDLPDGGGQDVLAFVQEHWPHTPVIITCAQPSLQRAVETMRSGAFDFQQKPINREHLLLTTQRALEKAALHKAFDYLRHEQPYIYRLDNIQASSPPMREVLAQVERVAATDVTVILTGETGTGKSLVAGAIHANSDRAGRPLVTVNCAALPETLLESELFGHEKGAFTGAYKYRTGRFEQAHGGTLFLDEVGEMSPATQAKVLRAIEEKVVQRVGGSRSILVDVRILAATNLDLAKAVREGRFREDLFYRLNIAAIRMPALRERPEDLLPLAQRFLRRICRDSKHSPKQLSAEACQALAAHSWPGNIRELRNVIERAVLFANGEEITSHDLGLERATPGALGTVPGGGQAESLPPTLELEALERWAIETALERSHWVQSRAAALLGISPRALSYKLDKLNLQNPSLEARRRRR